MVFNLDTFYTERNKRLNIRDEDIQEYVQRTRTSSARSQELFPFLYNNSSMPSESAPKSVGPSRLVEDIPSFRNIASSLCDRASVEHSQTQLPSIGPLVSTAGKRIQAKDHISRGSGASVDRNASNSLSSIQVQTTSVDMNVLNGGTKAKQNHKDDAQNVVDAPEFLRHSLSNCVLLDNNVFSSSLNQFLADNPVEQRYGAQPRQPPRSPSESSSPTSPESASSLMDILSRLPTREPESVQRPARDRLSEARLRGAKSAAGKHEKLIKLGTKAKAIETALVAVSKKKSLSDHSSIIDDSSSDPPSPPPQAVAPSGTFPAVLAPEGSDSNKPNNMKRRVIEKKDKGKVKLMLPGEYAVMLMEKAPPEHYSTVRKKYIPTLAGKNIFYTGGDMRYATERTRSRMDIIVRHGGNLIPRFDVSLVTHIVTDAQKGPTLRALDLRSLNDIPNHIPTVKWSWIVSRIGATQDDSRADEVWLHAAFSERIDAGIPKINPAISKNRTKDNILDATSISHISQFTQDKNSGKQRERINIDDISEFPTPNNLEGSPSRALLDVTMTVDPLEQFYAKAKADLESGSHHSDSDFGSISDRSDFGPLADRPLAKKRWTCDKREDEVVCPNQDVIDKLQELMEIHKSRISEEDQWRAFSYNKCIRILRRYPRRIHSLSEARSLTGVGEKTASKIMEIIETGQLRRIDYENTDDIKVTRLFQGVYGVGRSIAHRWYADGCRTLDDVLAGKGGVKLTPAQQIGIKFYSDINSRMPRDEAKAIFDLIKPIALQLDPKLFVEIMGSFRRGKADCGDIDILITRPTDDGKTHAGILSHLLRELHSMEILTEDLALPEDPYELEAIYRGLCHLPKGDSKRRRIDFLTVPWHSRGAALLYYTGDDIFNRAMRLKARVMGYSLNQRGLFAGVVRDPHDRSKKSNPGQLIASETEEEIFRILEVPWQEPHERIRG